MSYHTTTLSSRDKRTKKYQNALWRALLARLLETHAWQRLKKWPLKLHLSHPHPPRSGNILSTIAYMKLSDDRMKQYFTTPRIQWTRLYNSTLENENNVKLAFLDTISTRHNRARDLIHRALTLLSTQEGYLTNSNMSRMQYALTTTHY